MDEEEFRAVEPFGVGRRRAGEIARHFVVLPVEIGRIGGCIEGVLELATIARVAFEIGVRNGAGEHVVRIRTGHDGTIFVGRLLFPSAAREEEELVVGFRQSVEIRIVSNESAECAFGQCIVAEFLIFDHAGAEEGVAQQAVGFLLRLGGEGNVGEVVGAGVRIELVLAFLAGVARGVGRRVGLFAGELCGIVAYCRFEGIATQSFGREAVAAGSYQRLDAVFGGVVVALGLTVGQQTVVGAAPVVFVATVAPLPHESLFALLHSGGIIEVPRLVVRGAVGCGRGGGQVGGILSIAFVARATETVVAIAAIGLFLFLEHLDGVIDHGIAGRLGHASQREQ